MSAFCICENKAADHLCGNNKPGLCWTWSETPKTVFLTTRFILFTWPHSHYIAISVKLSDLVHTCSPIRAQTLMSKFVTRLRRFPHDIKKDTTKSEFANVFGM